jgi:hypothetical protein
MSQFPGVIVARSSIIVKNAPYSAETTSTNIQTLFDGNKITTKYATKVYRDSEGRTRTEQILSESEMKSSFRQERELITIEDPVAGYAYYLNTFTKTARKVELKPFELPIRPTVIDAKEQNSNSYKYLRENLPDKTIEGLVCRGTLTKTTIPPETAGNEKELVTTSESWFSDELKIGVLYKTKDPRTGERITETKNISRIEPDKSLFVVPKDYKIIVVAPLKED